MNRQERIEKALRGESVDRVPVALWRHWQGDDQRATDLAKAVIQFQRHYDWDMCLVPPAPHFMVTGYGLQDDWQGTWDGTRTVTKTPVSRSLDWTDLRPIDPLRADMGKQLETIRLIVDVLQAEEVPVVPVIYSPLAQAFQLATQSGVLRHMRTHPDRLKTGLSQITENTLRWLDALRKIAIQGIYYVMGGASLEVLSEGEYATFGFPYDQKLLSFVQERGKWGIASVQGESPMLKQISQLPVQAINWQSHLAHPSLEEGKGIIEQAIMGGISKQELQYGTPISVRETIRRTLQATDSKRLILASDGAFLIATPLSNLQAIRDSVKVTVF